MDSEFAPNNAHLLKDFIHELNSSRRLIGLYPVTHPRVIAQATQAMHVFKELLANHPEVNLGISAAGISLGPQLLDCDTSYLRDFADFFIRRGIASVSFRSGLSLNELISFNRLFNSTRPHTNAPEDLNRGFRTQGIEHIRVRYIDYRAFTQKDSRALEEREASLLWERFLRGLHLGLLDSGHKGTEETDRLARILNDKFPPGQAPEAGLNELLTAFVRNSFTPAVHQQDDAHLAKKLNCLLSQLHPPPRQLVLATTLTSLDSNPPLAERLINKINPEHLIEGLKLYAHNQLHVSSRLVQLLQTLAGQHYPARFGQPQPATDQASRAMMRARLQELFREEQQQKYLPGSYDHALEQILREEIPANQPEERSCQELLKTFKRQPIEQPLVNIILELLDNHPQAETEKLLQSHLQELSRFFLDTGDFMPLKKIYLAWQNYLNTGSPHCDMLSESVLTCHHQLSFLNEVLDSYELWGAEKHAQISAYIAATGPLYAGVLINRLAEAATITEQNHWSSLLLKLGTAIHGDIFQALANADDKLAGKLLQVLRPQMTPQALKAILPFCEHQNPSLRIEAILNLFQCNQATANRYLLKELHNPDPGVRKLAIDATRCSDSDKIEQLLCGMLQQKARNKADQDLQYHILHALQCKATPRIIAVLRSILLDKTWFVPATTRQLQAEIIRQLPEFPAATTRELILELFRSRHGKRLQQAISKHQGKQP